MHDMKYQPLSSGLQQKYLNSYPFITVIYDGVVEAFIGYGYYFE